MKSTPAWLFTGIFAASCGAENIQSTEATDESPILEEFIDELPNNFPLPNSFGSQSTFSTEGFVDLSDAFSTPPGNNGRDCATCHAVESGWSINPNQIEFLFWLSGGTDPIFHPADANNPNMPRDTIDQKRAAYSNLLRGTFRRNSTPPATSEYDIVAVDDPNGFADTARFTFFRRSPTTANLSLLTGILWDDRLTVPGDGHPPRQGLFNLARAVTIGALGGPASPDPALINEMVDDELQIYHAQLIINGLGRLDSCGGRGGPEILSTQPLVAGRFDLYDAWIDLRPGSCGSRSADRKRAQIARGQELFNDRQNANGGTCRGCHNSVNSGTNVNGTVFNIGTSNPEHRPANHPLYTLRNRTSGEELQTSDPGKAGHTGRWSDMNRFKVPTLRGAGSRAPFFHNGIARDLNAVVYFYSVNLAFNFTLAEKEDLVAFLEAL
jgi:hypothetical protein